MKPCPLCGKDPIFYPSAKQWACSGIDHGLWGPADDEDGNLWGVMVDRKCLNTTWRGHTCGECAWIAREENDAGRYGICRRSAFSNTCALLPETPACPAWEKGKDNE